MSDRVRRVFDTNVLVSAMAFPRSVPRRAFEEAIRDGEVLASVRDLIAILDSERGSPITTEELRYGFRVAVIAMPSDEKWRTPAGVELGGPRYFRYDLDFVPGEERFGTAPGQ